MPRPRSGEFSPLLTRGLWTVAPFILEQQNRLSVDMNELTPSSFLQDVRWTDVLVLDTLMELLMSQTGVNFKKYFVGEL